ncbi:MAG: pantetheine-phosphate adenylyltransferase [Tannerella sp.]|jgi:pantetheine-phosphate adenylyltransferase|nr:pantetheine-phosphate adenylyltransferase [Tannerella sp.]
MCRTALFAGSFDPFTIAHFAVVKRALCLADKIIVAVGVNFDKKTFRTLEQRLEGIQQAFKDDNRVEAAHYEGLTTDFALQRKIDFFIRGIRSINDFEYEKNMAYINLKLSGIETVFIFSEPEYEHISSSLVRELAYYHKDISQLIPNYK